MTGDAASYDITLPSFGSSVGSATLIEWHTKVGAQVEAGQVIAEVETDKAVAEVETPYAGVIDALLVAEGSEDLEIGTVLARLRLTDDASHIHVEAEELPDNSATAEATSEAQTSESTATVAQPKTRPSTRVKASPYARTLARERGIDLEKIAGSGPSGRIVSLDVPPVAPSAKPDSVKLLAEAGHAPGTYTIEPVSKMRRAIAVGVQRSARDIPAYSLVAKIDLDKAIDYRRRSNSAPDNGLIKLSLNDIVVWACGQALQAVPIANTAWTNDGIASFRSANVAIAISTSDGLVAPVIREAETKSVQEVAEISRRLIREAREGRLSNDDLRGATFTVSNLGMKGIHAFTSIPGPMQGCILSVGAAEPCPVVRDDKVVVVTQASFTLTCDHRVIDGAIGAEFLDRLGAAIGSI